MAQALVKNNAYSTLAAGISAVATSITVAVGHGSRFPTVSGGNFFYATLVDAANVIEIVKVVGRAGDVLTVTRGQDGTTAVAYLLGDRIELRPTAALFDDKMSKGGGIFTGPIEVPAGAATTQAPQIQEVVKRAGDSMTGPLILPELRGVSGIIDLQAGDRILSPDAGGLLAPGMLIQTVHNLVDTITTYSVTPPASSSVVGANAAIAALNTIITPKFASSKVLIHINLVGDINDFNTVFVLERNGTLIGRSTVGAERWYGGFAAGNLSQDSRPETWHLMFLDSPGSIAAQTYKLLFQSSVNSTGARTFYLNRSVNSAPVSQHEGGVSQMLLQELYQ